MSENIDRDILNKQLPNWSPRLRNLLVPAGVPTGCVPPESLFKFQKAKNIPGAALAIESYTQDNIRELTTILDDAKTNFTTDPAVAPILSAIETHNTDLEKLNQELLDANTNKKFAEQDISYLRSSRTPSTDPAYTAANTQIQTSIAEIRTKTRDIELAKRQLAKLHTDFTKVATKPDRARQAVIKEVSAHYSAILESLKKNKIAVDRLFKANAKDRRGWLTQEEQEDLSNSLQYQIEDIQAEIDRVFELAYDENEPQSFVARSQPRGRNTNNRNPAPEDDLSRRREQRSRNGNHAAQINDLQKIINGLR
jgi:DNA-binding protein H-NS